MSTRASVVVAQRILRRRGGGTESVDTGGRPGALLGATPHMSEEEGRLFGELTSRLPGAAILLRITDNQHTMISVHRRKGPAYRVRLHRMFLSSTTAVLDDLARYIARNDRVASSRLGDFIEEREAEIRRAPARRRASVNIITQGEVHDLIDIFSRLNRHYFQGRIDAKITWGKRSRRKRRHSSIKMGSYSVEERLIRIHPALDRPFVPRPFIEWIVYHEMLHQVHPIPTIGGRRIFHTDAFWADERKFEQYPEARRWEQQNLDKLLYY